MALPDDHDLRALLAAARTIAVVGLSSNPDRPSFQVAKYLQAVGYLIIPVHPAVREVLGEKAYASLEEIPDRVDIVDVFRRSEQTPEVARSAVAIGARALWLQEGITNAQAEETASRAGLLVVSDRCLLKEHRRLLGGIK